MTEEGRVCNRVKRGCVGGEEKRKGGRVLERRTEQGVTGERPAGLGLRRERQSRKQVLARQRRQSVRSEVQWQ